MLFISPKTSVIIILNKMSGVKAVNKLPFPITK